MAECLSAASYNLEHASITSYLKRNEHILLEDNKMVYIN